MTRRFLLGAAVAASLALAPATAAHATQYEHFTFTFEDSVEEDVCGIDARIDTVVRGVIVGRYLNDGRDQAFLGHNTIRASDTFTNLATGESFRIEARIREGDVTGRHVEGDIYEFTFTRAGLERVIDGDGDVVVRDSGVIRRTYLFDTLGDGMPGGELVDELSLSVRGPHPLFEMDEDEFCALVHELIG